MDPLENTNSSSSRPVSMEVKHSPVKLILESSPLSSPIKTTVATQPVIPVPLQPHQHLESHVRLVPQFSTNFSQVNSSRTSSIAQKSSSVNPLTLPIAGTTSPTLSSPNSSFVALTTGLPIQVHPASSSTVNNALLPSVSNPSASAQTAVTTVSSVPVVSQTIPPTSSHRSRKEKLICRSGADSIEVQATNTPSIITVGDESSLDGTRSDSKDGSSSPSKSKKVSSPSKTPRTYKRRKENSESSCEKKPKESVKKKILSSGAQKRKEVGSGNAPPGKRTYNKRKSKTSSVSIDGVNLKDFPAHKCTSSPTKSKTHESPSKFHASKTKSPEKPKKIGIAKGGLTEREKALLPMLSKYTGEPVSNGDVGHNTGSNHNVAIPSIPPISAASSSASASDKQRLQDLRIFGSANFLPIFKPNQKPWYLLKRLLEGKDLEETGVIDKTSFEETKHELPSASPLPSVSGGSTLSTLPVTASVSSESVIPTQCVVSTSAGLSNSAESTISSTCAESSSSSVSSPLSTSSVSAVHSTSSVPAITCSVSTVPSVASLSPMSATTSVFLAPLIPTTSEVLSIPSESEISAISEAPSTPSVFQVSTISEAPSTSEVPTISAASTIPLVSAASSLTAARSAAALSLHTTPSISTVSTMPSFHEASATLAADATTAITASSDVSEYASPSITSELSKISLPPTMSSLLEIPLVSTSIIDETVKVPEILLMERRLNSSLDSSGSSRSSSGAEDEPYDADETLSSSSDEADTEESFSRKGFVRDPALQVLAIPFETDGEELLMSPMVKAVLERMMKHHPYRPTPIAPVTSDENNPFTFRTPRVRSESESSLPSFACEPNPVVSVSRPSSTPLTTSNSSDSSDMNFVAPITPNTVDSCPLQRQVSKSPESYQFKPIQKEPPGSPLLGSCGAFKWSWPQNGRESPGSSSGATKYQPPSPSPSTMSGSSASGSGRRYSRRRFSRMYPAFETSHCLFSKHFCPAPLEPGSTYCIKHINEKSSPFYVRCAFMSSKNGRRCHNMQYSRDGKNKFCNMHASRLALLRQKLYRKPRPLPALTEHLGDLKRIQNKLKKPKRNEAAAYVEDYCDYKLQTQCMENEIEVIDPPDANMSVGALSRFQADHDSDGGCEVGDEYECLKNAGYYSTEEVVKILKSKLSRLKELYVKQFDFLKVYYLIKRKEYLEAEDRIKNSGIRISRNPKTLYKWRDRVTDDFIRKEMKSYEKSKVLLNYHKLRGQTAVFHHLARKKYEDVKEQEAKEKQYTLEENSDSDDESGQNPILRGFLARSAANKETSPIKNKDKRCKFDDGIITCNMPPLPCASYCHQHILEEENQALFQPCNFPLDDKELCQNPLLKKIDRGGCGFHKSFRMKRFYKSKEEVKSQRKLLKETPIASLKEHMTLLEDLVASKFSKVEDFDDEVNYVLSKGLECSDTSHSDFENDYDLGLVDDDDDEDYEDTDTESNGSRHEGGRRSEERTNKRVALIDAPKRKRNHTYRKVSNGDGSGGEGITIKRAKKSFANKNTRRSSIASVGKTVANSKRKSKASSASSSHAETVTSERNSASFSAVFPKDNHHEEEEDEETIIDVVAVDFVSSSNFSRRRLEVQEGTKETEARNSIEENNNINSLESTVPLPASDNKDAIKHKEVGTVMDPVNGSTLCTEEAKDRKSNKITQEEKTSKEESVLQLDIASIANTLVESTLGQHESEGNIDSIGVTEGGEENKCNNIISENHIEEESGLVAAVLSGEHSSEVTETIGGNESSGPANESSDTAIFSNVAPKDKFAGLDNAIIENNLRLDTKIGDTNISDKKSQQKREYETLSDASTDDSESESSMFSVTGTKEGLEVESKPAFSGLENSESTIINVTAPKEKHHILGSENIVSNTITKEILKPENVPYVDSLSTGTNLDSKEMPKPVCPSKSMSKEVLEESRKLISSELNKVNSEIQSSPIFSTPVSFSNKDVEKGIFPPVTDSINSNSYSDLLLEGNSPSPCSELSGKSSGSGTNTPDIFKKIRSNFLEFSNDSSSDTRSSDFVEVEESSEENRDKTISLPAEAILGSTKRTVIFGMEPELELEPISSSSNSNSTPSAIDLDEPEKTSNCSTPVDPARIEGESVPDSP